MIYVNFISLIQLSVSEILYAVMLCQLTRETFSKACRLDTYWSNEDIYDFRAEIQII